MFYVHYDKTDQRRLLEVKDIHPFDMYAVLHKGPASVETKQVEIIIVNDAEAFYQTTEESVKTEEGKNLS